MRRFWITLCVVCGVALLIAALLVPAHFGAVDAKAIEFAGAKTPALVEEGQNLLARGKVGPAEMLLKATTIENVRAEKLKQAIDAYKASNPDFAAWGGIDPAIENLRIPTRAKSPMPVVELLMQRDVRLPLLQFLQTRARARAQLSGILANREITGWANFPPATTASGQATEAVIVITGLLYQGDHLEPRFAEVIEFLAMTARKRSEDMEQMELFYLDILSLGKRLDWISLVELMKKVENVKTLRQLAEACRNNEDQFPALYAAVQLSQRPADVAKYLDTYSKTGVNDLSFAAASGVGGIEMLLNQQTRVHRAGTYKNRLLSYNPFGWWFDSMLGVVEKSPRGAVLLKYALFLVGSLLVARAVGVIGGVTQWRGLRFGADTVVALSLAFILVLFSEPFLGVPSQVRDFPIRLKIPTVALSPGSPLYPMTRPFMNNNTTVNLLPVLVFFVIQALIYIWCLAKLNEIRRQAIAPHLKLKLLENEDHLFDAGLYIGFVGTIIGLMLFMLRFGNFSAMSAYSSTSFGIIFVSVLKIFHVRPLRRKLILESETAAS